MTRAEEDAFRSVIRLGIEMRAAQRKYFRTREMADLVKSKRFEKAYDAAANAVFVQVPTPESQDCAKCGGASVTDEKIFWDFLQN